MLPFRGDTIYYTGLASPIGYDPRLKTSCSMRVCWCCLATYVSPMMMGQSSCLLPWRPRCSKKPASTPSGKEFSRLRLAQGGDLRQYYPLSEEARGEYEAWKAAQQHRG